MKLASAVIFFLVFIFISHSLTAQTTGLVAHYTFDETLDGGSVVGTANYVEGKVGKALSFNGNGQYVNLGTISSGSVFSSPQWTMAAWVNWDGASYNRGIFKINDSQNHSTGLSNNTSGNQGKFYATVWLGPSSLSATCTSVTPLVGQWYHLAAAWNGSTLQLYVDGNLCGTSTSGTNTYDASGDWVSIGTSRQNAPGDAWGGAIDDVYFYSRAIALDEVQSLYAMGGTSPNAPPSDPPQNLQTPPTEPPPSQPSVPPAPVKTITWTPPLGIPDVPFGIREDVTMYLRAGSTFDYGSGLEVYRLNSSGEPYTHYIDTTRAASTDTNNPFGTPTKPRKTIPWNLPAGSVVEIHGGPYAAVAGNSKKIYGVGTAAKPIFIRGASVTTMPHINADVFVNGSYIILENLKFYKASVILDHRSLPGSIDHISVRHSELYGDGTELLNSAAVSVGPWNIKSTNTISDIVVYKNYIHDLGSMTTTLEKDYNGVNVSGYDVFRVWVVDNKFERLSSAAARFGNNEFDLNGSPFANSRYGYFGRNTFFYGGENGFAAKQTNDVVVSQNTMAHFERSGHNSGSILNVLYRPTNVWYIFNTIYDAPIGIKSSGVKDFYAVGNDIRNVNTGINYWNVGEMYIIGNTISSIAKPTTAFSEGHGISNSGGGATPRIIAGNHIKGFSGPASPLYFFYLISTGEALNVLLDYNLFDAQGATVVYNFAGKPASTLSQFITATNKCTHCIEGSASPVDTFDASAIEFVFQRFTQLFGTSIKYDLNGVPRPQGNAWDIGAYESGGSATPPPPTVTIVGDFNKDGVVNSLDLSLMASVWNQNNSTYDLTKDGTVNTLDYSIMVRNWTS